MSREANLGIAVGQKGVGKTYETLLMISEYLMGTAGGMKPRKVLVLDTNNEFANVRQDHNNPNFPEIKAIALKDIPKFAASPKVEARRVSILKPEGGKMSLSELQDALDFILKYYQNGLFLIEDINKFISDSLPNDLIGSIATQRHVSVDIIIHFQTIGKAGNPKLWGNCQWIRYHKCEDTVERHKSKFLAAAKPLQILEQLVQMKYDQGDQRFFAYFMKDQRKIQGEFTQEEFKQAVELYLQANDSIIDKEIKKKHLYSRKLVHNSPQEAVTSLVTEYVTTYYGNAA